MRLQASGLPRVSRPPPRPPVCRGGFSFLLPVAKTISRFAVRADIYVRTLFLAGCFAGALTAAGFKPRPVQSGPLEDRIGQVAGHILTSAIATGRITTGESKETASTRLGADQNGTDEPARARL